jgi:hypothetical protein
VANRHDLHAGDRVTILARSLRGHTGKLVRPARLPNLKRAWLVELDQAVPLLSKSGRVRVGEWALQRDEVLGDK